MCDNTLTVCVCVCVCVCILLWTQCNVISYTYHSTSQIWSAKVVACHVVTPGKQVTPFLGVCMKCKGMCHVTPTCVHPRVPVCDIVRRFQFGNETISRRLVFVWQSVISFWCINSTEATLWRSQSPQYEKVEMAVCERLWKYKPVFYWGGIF